MTGLTEVGTGEAGFDRLRRTAMSMLQHLTEAAQALEVMISQELERSPVKDPNDRAYPMLARSLEGRLTNIRATIASLERVA
jgi:hypothetical protein